MTNDKITFLKLFRFIFVIFSLYLLRDVFFVWDGFRFYAPFSDFIPTAALVAVIWTLAAFLLNICVWIVLRLIEKLCHLLGLRVGIEHILFFVIITPLLGLVVWEIKRKFWPDVQTSIQLKGIVFLCVALASSYPVWLCRNRVEQWFNDIQKRLTPLIWIFGIVVVLSVPVVSYSVFSKDSFKPVPKSFTPSPKQSSNKKRPNILLVSFDALTARDMSLHGYERETTPFMNKWASNATVFTKAEASSNHTSPANASMMTGKRVWTHQLFQQGGFPVKGDVESLPRELKKNGYFNIAFVVNPWASTTKMEMLNSFDISPLSVDFNRNDEVVTFDGDLPGVIDNLLYRVFGNKIRKYDWVMENRLLGALKPFIAPYSRIMNPEYSKTAFPPEKAFNRLLDIYDELPEPFFAWVHVYPPHAYCLPPETYRGMFGPRFPPERFKGNILNNEPHNLRDNRILYDEFIRYCDKQFEDFVIKLESKNKHKNTTVILTSDHGESFQHGVYGHGFKDLYEQHTHIPLIIKEYNQTSGKVIESLVEQIDVPSTILDLVDIPIPEWMEGRSLVPLIQGEELPQRPAYSMFLRLNRSRGYPITKGTIAVWEGDYKLIHFLGEEKSLLFNLQTDPEEMDNLVHREPEIGKHLLDLIKTNLGKANQRILSKKQSD